MALFGKRRSNEPPTRSGPVDVVGDLITRLHNSASSVRTDAEEELRRLRRETSDPEVAKRIARALLEQQKARGAVRKARRDVPPPRSPTSFGEASVARREVEFEYPHPGTNHSTEVKLMVSASGELFSYLGGGAWDKLHSFGIAVVRCKGCPVWQAERSLTVPVETLLQHSEVQRAIRELQASEEEPAAGSEPTAAACAVCGVDLSNAPAVRDNMTGALYCFEHREYAGR